MIRGSVSTSSARAKVVFLHCTHLATAILYSSVFVAKILKDPRIESTRFTEGNSLSRGNEHKITMDAYNATLRSDFIIITNKVAIKRMSNKL